MLDAGPEFGSTLFEHLSTHGWLASGRLWARPHAPSAPGRPVSVHSSLHELAIGISVALALTEIQRKRKLVRALQLLSRATRAISAWICCTASFPESVGNAAPQNP